MKRGFWAVLLLIALIAKVSCQDNENSGGSSNPDKGSGNDNSSSNGDAAKGDNNKDDSSSNKKKKSKNGVSAMAFSGLLLFVSSMLFSLQ